jgi:hypothetical protein
MATLKKRLLPFSITLIVVLTTAFFAFAQEGPPPQKLPEIPGITTKDKTPYACVDCHKNYPERKMDARLSVILKKWQKEVDPKHLKKAQGVMESGFKLEGKHPNMEGLVKVIPDDCLMCHWRGAKKVPPFSKLLHAIHLVGGKDNHFMTMFQGQCTMCHKLDKSTGTWTIGSGTE